MHIIKDLFRKKAGYVDSFGVLRDLEKQERKERMYALKQHPSLLRLHKKDMFREVNALLSEKEVKSYE